MLQLMAVGGFVSILCMVLGTAVIFGYYAKDLPSPSEIVRRDGFSTKVFDRNGLLLYDVFQDENRTPISIDQIPDTLKQATIAIEDKEFYTHGGYDPKGLVRAALVTIFQGRKQGGSTLTQQLVKNGLLTNERSLPRKIKEFVLAVQIERLFNKDEILQMYLNEIPYGGTAWGAASAAQMYFGKPVSELTLVESAVLAGIPQRPSYYNPFGTYPEAYIDRATGVLRRMREDGYITKAQEDEAVAQLPNVQFATSKTTINAPHFVFHVTEQLEEMFGEEVMERGGLRVTTTLDLDFHKYAQASVSAEIAKVEELGISNGAAVVMNPKTGEILSMIGSKDFYDAESDGQVNVATRLRQPGSTIKPITYALALERGFTPASMIMDVRTEFPAGPGQPMYIPVNYDGSFRGPVQLRYALGSSLNIPAVKLLALVGIPDMLQLAYDMGIKSLEPTQANLSRFGLAVTLGGGEVTLLEMTTAYSVFANSGMSIEPVSILQVEDADGRVLYQHRQIPGKRVLSEEASFLISSILSDNQARLLSFGANSLLNFGTQPVAVKTGTTNDRRDNWTVGWTTEAVVGVWVGNNDNSPMKQVASGISGASPIWRAITLEANRRWKPQEFSKPATVESVMVDTISGYPEHNGFPSRSEFVVKSTLPTTSDPVHLKLKLCRGQERLATVAQVASREYEEKEYFIFSEDDPVSNDGVNRWQDGINAWLSSQSDSRYRPPTEYCDGEEGIVRITYPEHQRNYDGNEIDVDMSVFSTKRVEELEILINGDRKETLTSQPFKTKLTLPPGAYELKGKAKLDGGQTIESGTLRFGLGGVYWDGSNQANPTPSPQVSPAPSPTP